MLAIAGIFAIAAVGSSCSGRGNNDQSDKSMNEVIKTLKERRSVRSYTDEIPSREVLEQIAEAGIYAPNGMGQQNVKLLFISDKEIRDKVSSLNAKVMNREGSDPFYGAPVVVVALAPKDSPTATEDGVLALANVMTAAEALGVSTCYIHRANPAFNTEEGKKIISDLGIEGEWQAVANVIMGYRDGEKPVPAERKSDRIYIVE